MALKVAYARLPQESCIYTVMNNVQCTQDFYLHAYLVILMLYSIVTWLTAIPH